MGPMEVLADAYYGASTRRAQLNFPISDLRFSSSFIRALSLIKLAAARVNHGLGLLDGTIAVAVEKAAQEVADGKLDEHFVVDVFQTGSGTSTNTNANEVIANRATEIMGGERGAQLAHPNDHVNMGQSSNDVIPTAIHLAALTDIQDRLFPALGQLRDALDEKSVEFWPIIKTAGHIFRTQRPSAWVRSSKASPGRWSKASAVWAMPRRSFLRWPWEVPL